MRVCHSATPARVRMRIVPQVATGGNYRLDTNHASPLAGLVSRTELLGLPRDRLLAMHARLGTLCAGTHGSRVWPASCRMEDTGLVTFIT